MISSKFIRLIYLDMFIFGSVIRLFLHFIFSYAEESWFHLSQFMFLLQKLYMIFQLSNTNGAPPARESCKLLKDVSKLTLVDGLSTIIIWNHRVSSSIFYLTSRYLWSGKTSINRSLSFIPSFLFLFWLVVQTSKLLQHIHYTL